MKRTLFAGCASIFIQGGGGVYDPVRHVESARLYGNIDAYAYYFVDLLVGNPPQRASVILDTGSGLTAFPCHGCPHCGKHIDPNFHVDKSSTFKWINCGTSSCHGSCTSGHCGYRQSYQEGSSISGYWFQDQVRLGDGIQKNPPITAQLGCHQNENKLFYTQKANGIFGIQGSRTLLQLLFDDHEHIESKIFSICLAEWGGRLTVGGHNASYHRSQIQYVPLVGSRYGVGLTEMRVDGQTIRNFRTSVIDSGTTYTYMGSAPYKALRAAIEQACKKKNCGKKSGTCYQVPGLYAGLKEFPNVEVRFNSVVTTWEPRAYLYRKGNSNSFCYGFQDDGASAPTVLGASWMLYKEVIFDLRSNRVGLVKADCPEYKERPPHDSSTFAKESKLGSAGKPTQKPATASSGDKPATKKPKPPKAATGKPKDVSAANSLKHRAKSSTASEVAKSREPPKLVASPDELFKTSATRSDDEQPSASRLPMEWHRPSPQVLAISTIVVIVGAVMMAGCIARLASKRPQISHKKIIEMEPNAVKSNVVGSSFDTGDGVVDENVELVQKPAKEKVGNKNGPLD